MALRIRPLSEGSSSGLAIRPLDELLASFAAPAGPVQGADGRWYTQDARGNWFDAVGPSGPVQAAPQPPAQPGASAADVGGNSEGSIGASLGFGLNGADTTAGVAFNFGQLAGQSPLAAALNFSPLGTPTPAGILGSLLSLAPAPPGVTSLLGMGMRAAQQATINQAMQNQLQLTALRESMAPMSFRGGIDTEGITGLTDTGIPGITGTPGFSDDPGAPGITGDPGDGPGVGVGSAGDSGDAGSAGDAGGPGAFHTGGSVTKGAPKGPDRRATLREGEFVVRKSAAQAHRPLLEAINRNEPPKKLRKLLDYLMEPTEAKKA